jgi:Caspase domain
VTGQRKALIVANDKYDQAALRDLRAPLADAEALRQVLADPEIGGFAVQVVRNESAHVIAGQLEDIFSEGRPDDVLLVHFSGHGLKSESGELFFAASNTRIDRLGSTAVAADFLQRCMRDSRSRSIVLLLDCCYSGAFAKGVRVRAGGDINVLDSFPKGKARPNPMPHIEQITPAGPGVVLMCTAGLWRYQPEAAELAALALPAALHRPLDAAADLVKFVLDSGGLDNITAVLIPFPPGD